MAEPLNLVLVTIDSLRRDALGCLHPDGGPTPRLDRLATSGELYTNAVSNGPRTPSAFPAILCSLHPLVSGETGLPPGAATLAEALSNAGHRTAGFNLDNPYLSEACGYARGFERYDDFWQATPGVGNAPVRPSPVKRLKKRVQDAIGRRSLPLLLLLQAMVQRGGAPFTRGNEATRRALDWIDDAAGAPFFTWIHYMDVHFPYLPLERPGPGRRLRFLGGALGWLVGARQRPLKLLRRLYRDRVARMDRIIGRLADGLTERGLERNTIIVVTADHGEAFGEHGSYTHGPRLYDELLRVPLIIAGPGPQRTEDRQVGLIGLAPTLLHRLGVEPPAAFQGRTFDAQDDGPVISAATHAGGRRRRGAAAESFRIVSCRHDGWKLIHDDEGEREELYDLAADPAETVNLVERHPDRAGPLRERVRQHLAAADQDAARLGEAGAGRAFHEDEEVARRLADLGYL